MTKKNTTHETLSTPPIYRVIARITGSLQPRGLETYWEQNILYCGTDRTEARVAYHRSSPHDYFRGYGNNARKTIMEIIEDTGTDDATDDCVMTTTTD